MATMDIFDLTDTWNAGGTTFTAIKMNATDSASAADSLLMDLQVGGVSQFKVAKGGRITAQTLTLGLGGQTAVATNTALGVQALNSASLTGANNVGVGYLALAANTSGISNSAVGAGALVFNTTGDANTAMGINGLAANTTGSANSALGAFALYNNTTGGNNSAMGRGALFANTTGANNIAIGYQAGDAITTGSTNLVIGYDIDVDSATGSNQINIADRYFHNRISLAGPTNASVLASSGGSLTGANSQSLVDLAATWNTTGTPTAFKVAITDTASNSNSLLMDFLVGGSSRFSLSKGGAVVTGTVEASTAAVNVSALTVSNYSLTAANTASMVDLAGTWNTTGTPTLIKANVTDTASDAASLLMDLQTGGTSRLKVAKNGAITATSGTAIPAGGTAGAGVMVSSTANFGVFFGSGAPTLSAAKGSLYLRSDGTTTNDRAYINTDSGTTWTALTTAA